MSTVHKDQSEWKEILGWEGLYEVNRLGEVRNMKTMRLIQGDKNSVGYPRVLLYSSSHSPQRQRFFRHRLVAESFIPNPLNLPEVDHIDSNRSNSNCNNLMWVTRKENEQRCYYRGSKPYYPFVAEFYDGIHAYDHPIELAEEVGVSANIVREWLKGNNEGYLNFGIDNIRYI